MPTSRAESPAMRSHVRVRVAKLVRVIDMGC